MNRALVPGVPVSKEAAFDFLRSKGVEGSPHYERTVHNATTGEDIADMFRSGGYWVKTDMRTVLEWYREGYTTPEGEDVFGCSLDLESAKPIDVYRVTSRGIEKTAPNGEVTLTVLLHHRYTELPEVVQDLLRDFPFKDSIVLYSEKPYGHIVEYTRTW